MVLGSGIVVLKSKAWALGFELLGWGWGFQVLVLMTHPCIACILASFPVLAAPNLDLRSEPQTRITTPDTLHPKPQGIRYPTPYTLKETRYLM